MRGYVRVLLIFLILIISLQSILLTQTADTDFSSIRNSNEELSRHWTTKTGRSIIEDFFQNTIEEKFFAMVDTLGVSHQIQVTPFRWFFMEERVTPQIGMKIQLYDPNDYLYEEALINYGNYSPLIIEFVPHLTGEWTLTLIEEYGDDDQWDNEYGWESGEVVVDFLGFQYVYTFHDEVDIGFWRIRSVEETYNMYLYLEDGFDTVTFEYLALPIDTKDAVDEISVYTLDNKKIFSFTPDSHEEYQSSLSLEPNRFYRVEIKEARSSYTMIYIFAFKQNDGTHLPLYLQNLEDSFPSSFPIIDTLEDFDMLVPIEFDALSISQDITNISVEGKGANKIDYEFFEINESWIELYVVSIDNPFDFTFLNELSIWIYEDGQQLKFYYYLNNVEWGDPSHTWLEFSGAMLWEVEISHEGWENIIASKDEFVMVQFDSFDFSRIGRISIGIMPITSSVTNDTIYFDAFSAKLEPVSPSPQSGTSDFSFSTQLTNRTSISSSQHTSVIFVPKIEGTPGFELFVVLLIFVTVIIYRKHDLSS